MLQEKAMVNDALAMVKTNLTAYTTAITECSNPGLRSAYQQIRNNCESTQYELYKLAEVKGYYQPATMANDQDVQQLKTQLQSS